MVFCRIDGGLTKYKEAVAKLKRKMIRIALLFIPALICRVVFFGCSTDKAGPQDEEKIERLAH